jgi:hypothetical protein
MITMDNLSEGPLFRSAEISRSELRNSNRVRMVAALPPTLQHQSGVGMCKRPDAGFALDRGPGVVPHVAIGCVASCGAMRYGQLLPMVQAVLRSMTNESAVFGPSTDF